jgi:hypothetical protein
MEDIGLATDVAADMSGIGGLMAAGGVLAG